MSRWGDSDDVTAATESIPIDPGPGGQAKFTAAPGSVVIVRDEEWDEEWLVTSVEAATDGYFVNVIGLSEMVRDTEATQVDDR